MPGIDANKRPISRVAEKALCLMGSSAEFKPAQRSNAELKFSRFVYFNPRPSKGRKTAALDSFFLSNTANMSRYECEIFPRDYDYCHAPQDVFSKKWPVFLLALSLIPDCPQDEVNRLLGAFLDIAVLVAHDF